MTKNILKIAFISAFTLSGLTACDLDIAPEGKLTIDGTWEKVSDAQNYENGMFASFRGTLGSTSQTAQADLFNAGADFGNNGGALHRWDFDSADGIWTANYGTIKEANNIINNIDNVATADDEEKATVNNIKGEAYLIRAICYHNIVIRYAKDYEASTAASDLGLPLALTVDVNNKPVRSTLQQTYDQIKSDLTEARRLLNNADAANIIKLNTYDLDLFEARVSLYLDDYATADKLAQNVINSGKYPLISTQADYASMWLNDAGTEIMFQPAASTDELPPSRSVFINYSKADETYKPFWIPSQWVIDLYGDNDIRKATFFAERSVLEGAMTAPVNVKVLNKYPGNPALKKSADEISYYNAVKVFRVAEAYLISAEARHRQGQDTQAQTVLNQLRAARGEEAVTATGDALFTEIKNEWIREFIGEGFRLDNLKRWHDGFKRHDPQNTDVLVSTNPESYIELSVTSDNKRWVWEIPSNDRRVNPGIVPNWQ